MAKTLRQFSQGLLTMVMTSIPVVLFQNISIIFQDYFAQFGEVETVDRPVDKSTGVNKSFCFVTFKRDGVMKHAVKGKQTYPHF